MMGSVPDPSDVPPPNRDSSMSIWTTEEDGCSYDGVCASMAGTCLPPETAHLLSQFAGYGAFHHLAGPFELLEQAVDLRQ